MLWARRRLRRAAHLLHGSSLRAVAGFGTLSGQLCVARSTCDQQASGTGRAVPMDGLCQLAVSSASGPLPRPHHGAAEASHPKHSFQEPVRTVWTVNPFRG